MQGFFLIGVHVNDESQHNLILIRLGSSGLTVKVIILAVTSGLKLIRWMDPVHIVIYLKAEYSRKIGQ